MSLLSIVVIIVALVAFILMFRSKDLLRDEVQQAAFDAAASAQNISNPKKPFSLARVQTALWTIIILSAYIYEYFYKGCCGGIIPELNTTALTLLGLSIGVTAIAGATDNSQQNNPVRHQNNPSEGFINDILSDENGISIHRFQAVLFTIFAAIIYINKVCCDPNTLPELDKTLLGIITLSYSGYVGMKINENK